MNHSPLTQTDLALTALDGVVETLDGMIVARRPNNPTYRWGNYLLLPRPPEAEELTSLTEEFERRFGDDPETKHVTLRWDGPSLSAPAESLARERGMIPDRGLEMMAEALSAPHNPDVVVRELDMVRDRAEIVALNTACDPSERQGKEDYLQFKERMRREWWAWHRLGAARWWGAFLGEELVGQCGMIPCPGGLGRFQSVETHPDHRRKGVCSNLVATVGNEALTNGGCRSVLLGADMEGPALGLYRSLGFNDGVTQHALVLGGDSMNIRLETRADHAEVRSIVTRAFGRTDEASVIDVLRSEAGVISLVAERDGLIMGHALFSPVSNHDASTTLREGIALGPVAVRPSEQGRGVGSALIRDGLERCKQAGWSAIFVLGDPEFYQRFGWSAAAQWGLRSRWKVRPETFQGMELIPGALDGWRGLVRYHPVFDSLG